MDRDAKFGIMGALGTAIGGGDRRLVTRAICTSRVSGSTSGICRITATHRKPALKDIIQTWKGDKFDPDHLVGLYKQAGAKYFMSMGVHHDKL